MDITRNFLTDLLDKALECPVCLEQLNATAKVLPCQHTFCRRCLDEIVQTRQHLLCPECRIACDVRVEDLPPNILLIRLLEVTGPVIQRSLCLTSRMPPQSQSTVTSPIPVQCNSRNAEPLVSSVSRINDTNELNSNNNMNQKRHSFCSVSSPQTITKSAAPLLYQRSQSHYPESSKLQVTPNQSQQQQYRRSLEMLNNTNEPENGVWSTEFARTAIIRNSVRRNDENNDTNNSNSTDNGSNVIYYVAMYNYKPQKSDEIELKKGELYTVSEKCHDGWYKGVSVTNGSTGVFPGNYVQMTKSSMSPNAQFQCPVTTSSIQSRIAKPLQSTHHETTVVKELPIPKPKPALYAKPSVSLSSTVCLTQTSPAITTQPKTGENNTSSTLVYARPRPTGQVFQSATRNINSLVPLPPPPQRPPRPLSNTVAPNTKISADLSHTPQSQLANALNQSLLSKQQSSSQSSLTNTSQWIQPKVAATRNTVSLTASSSLHSANTAITPPNVSVQITPPTAAVQHKPPPSDKSDKHKEKSSFIKRFTSSKPKRKPQASPPLNNNNNVRNNSNNNSFSCDNPTFVDTSPSNLLAPIHVRSGSCPNESPLNVEVSAHRKQSSFDDSSNIVIKNTVANTSTKQTLQQQQQMVAPPLIRERFRCIVPYPPNSEYELELQVGDIVYVYKKRDDGWYKGTLQRTGKTGLFPGPFVESF